MSWAILGRYTIKIGGNRNPITTLILTHLPYSASDINFTFAVLVQILNSEWIKFESYFTHSTTCFWIGIFCLHFVSDFKFVFLREIPLFFMLIVIWLMLILIWIMLIFRTSEGLWWKSAYAKFFWIFFKLRTSENRTTENRISQGPAVNHRKFKI